MTDGASELSRIDVEADRGTLYRDGIVALKGAFPRDWAERMREDMMTAFWEAIQRPGGAVGRGAQEQVVRPVGLGPRPALGDEAFQFFVITGRIHQGLSTTQRRWESTAQAATK